MRMPILNRLSYVSTRQSGSRRLRMESLDENALNVYLLYWVYSSSLKDYDRAEEMLLALQDDVLAFFAFRNELFNAWFDYASGDIPNVFPNQTGMKLDIAVSLQRNLHARNISVEHYAAVLDLFTRLASNQDMRAIFEDAWSPRYNPVYWITRSIQQHIGIRDGRKLEMVLPSAMRAAL